MIKACLEIGHFEKTQTQEKLKTQRKTQTQARNLGLETSIKYIYLGILLKIIDFCMKKLRIFASNNIYLLFKELTGIYPAQSSISG